ncbi:MAG: DUF4112 domain-containing protein [Myxococcota bacterium]
MENAQKTAVATREESTDLAPLTEGERERVEKSLTRLDWLAELMDDKFELPIVRTKFGLDPIIGLIPGGGDWVTWVVSVYVFWEAAKMGAPKFMLVRMAGNTVVDLLAGYIPAVGDLFDVAWKANRRNVEMLKDYYGAETDAERTVLPVDIPRDAIREHRGPRWATYALVALLVVVLLGLAAVPFVVLWWLLHQ